MARARKIKILSGVKGGRAESKSVPVFPSKCIANKSRGEVLFSQALVFAGAGATREDPKEEKGGKKQRSRGHRNCGTTSNFPLSATFFANF